MYPPPFEGILPLVIVSAMLILFIAVIQENQVVSSQSLPVVQTEVTMTDDTNKNLEGCEGEPVLKIGLEKVDKSWDSEPCKLRVLDLVKAAHPCKQAFKRTQVIPLYEEGALRHYRATLWVTDYLQDPPREEIWKTFHVVLEGLERKLVSIEENKRPKMALTLNGVHFKEELENAHAHSSPPANEWRF
jgi:hypothetical protein